MTIFCLKIKHLQFHAIWLRNEFTVSWQSSNQERPKFNWYRFCFRRTDIGFIFDHFLSYFLRKFRIVLRNPNFEWKSTTKERVDLDEKMILK